MLQNVPAKLDKNKKYRTVQLVTQNRMKSQNVVPLQRQFI